jgi:hypothetical protein
MISTDLLTVARDVRWTTHPFHRLHPPRQRCLRLPILRRMDSLDLLLLKDVAREQGEHQQHDHDKQCPGVIGRAAEDSDPDGTRA